jgi:hypothetical protein
MNVGLHFTYNVLRLNLIICKKFESAFGPIFELLLNLQQKCACQDIVFSSKLSWIHSLIGN